MINANYYKEINNINDYNRLNQYNYSFSQKLKLCEKNLDDNLFGWIKESIDKNIPLIQIAEKFLNINYEKRFESVNYELFEAFIYYKNNKSINYKLSRYLRSSIGILGTYYYYDSNARFQIIFLTVKDIIKELDGDGFFNWLDQMCEH